jgi:hypothetical protein
MKIASPGSTLAGPDRKNSASLRIAAYYVLVPEDLKVAMLAWQQERITLCEPRSSQVRLKSWRMACPTTIVISFKKILGRHASFSQSIPRI